MKVTVDQIDYEVRRHPKLSDGFEVWRNEDDIGGFAVADGEIAYQGHFTGKVDRPTMTRVAETFVAMGYPRLATRSEILAALMGRHRLTPIEVAGANLDEVRLAFRPDVGVGNIVWRVPDSEVFGIVFAREGQAGPIRATVGSSRLSPEYTGVAIIVGEDSPYLLEDGGAMIRMITGRR